MSAKRVVIAQASMIAGGRLHTVLGITACLNKLGIVPELKSYRYKFDPSQVVDQYDTDILVQFKKFPLYFPLPADLNIVRFNMSLKNVGADCDLLINNSNSLIFLPTRANVLTYVHYPRKARIDSTMADVHNAHYATIRSWSPASIYKRGLRKLYRLSQPVPGHSLVCNSEFTRQALVKAYPQLTSKIEIIHPPVNLAKFEHGQRDRMPWVTSVGRFDVQKGQLRQIALAALFPKLTFHIVGFVADRRYYEKCRSYLKQNRIENVELHPQASFDEMVSLLRKSRYFLHTTVNEPFGITAIQAIASGCIPICHDSGGQRETVCIDALRYRDLDGAAGILRELQQQPPRRLGAMVDELKAHVRQYDEGVFTEKMTAILSDVLGL